VINSKANSQGVSTFEPLSERKGEEMEEKGKKEEREKRKIHKEREKRK
jgi:hypothetical protein